MKLVRKHNHDVAIVSTLERVYGTCGIDQEGTFSRAPDGSIEFHYDCNGTDLNWDSQQTVERRGHGGRVERVFIDQNGEEVLESDVEILP